MRDSDVGARNFLFINVPPIDRSPLVLIDRNVRLRKTLTFRSCRCSRSQLTRRRLRKA